MQHFRVLLLVLFTCLTGFKSLAQIPLSNKANITLLTCGSGDELYSVFGHTAIRVYDPESNIDTVYNFGTFDFNTPNFYLKFVKGDLQYFVSVSSYDEFIYTYKYYNRDVFEQVLNLNHTQEQEIADELAETLLSDKRFYTYKFIDRNCTTMVADIIAKYTGRISLENADSGKTYREIIYSYLKDGHFYENLGINLMFGAKTDKMLGKPFLPKELMEGVSNTRIPAGPLAQPAQTINKQHNDKEPFSFWNSYYSFAIAMLILLALSGKKLLQRSALAIGGLLGILFCVIGFYSLHLELLQNYNALLFNPLFLVLLYFVFMNNRKWIKITIYTNLACFVLYLALVFNKPHLIMMLPFMALFTAVLLRILKQQPAPRA